MKTDEEIGLFIEELNNRYSWLLKTLITMDEQQLIEVFHDLGDIHTVEKIADVAYTFIENHVDKSEYTGKLATINQCNEIVSEEIKNLPNPVIKKGIIFTYATDATKSYLGKSEYEEAKEIDDRQRYRDIKSTLDWK